VFLSPLLIEKEKSFLLREKFQLKHFSSLFEKPRGKYLLMNAGNENEAFKVSPRVNATKGFVSSNNKN
jgi:hypothetical protein